MLEIFEFFHHKEMINGSRLRWCTPIIPALALGRLKQEDHRESIVQATLDNRVQGKPEL